MSEVAQRILVERVGRTHGRLGRAECEAERGVGL